MSNLAICALPSSSLQDARSVECPPWCDPTRCETTDTDVRHASRMIKCTSRDAEVQLHLVRTDELAFLDQLPGPTTEIMMSLTSTSFDQRGEDGAWAYFDATELQRVLGQAFGLAALAQHDGALVTR